MKRVRVRSSITELSVKRCLKLRALLKNSMKERFLSYIAAVVQWIRMRISKVQLDTQVFSLLDESMRKTHFDFLVSLSKLCWGISSLRIETMIPSTSARSSSHDPQLQRLREPPETDNQNERVLLRKTYSDLSLPGIQLIRARLYLAAWDSGLTNVDSKVSRLLHLAMKNFVKDIIQAASLYKDPSTLHRSKSAQGLSFWWSLMQTNCDQPTFRYSTATTCGDRFKTSCSTFTR